MRKLILLIAVLTGLFLNSCNENEECPIVEPEVVYYDELQMMNEVLIGMPEMEMRKIYDEKGVIGSITSTPDDVYLIYSTGANWVKSGEGYELKTVKHIIHVNPAMNFKDRKVYLVEVEYE